MVHGLPEVPASADLGRRVGLCTKRVHNMPAARLPYLRRWKDEVHKVEVSHSAWVPEL